MNQGTFIYEDYCFFIPDLPTFATNVSGYYHRNLLTDCCFVSHNAYSPWFWLKCLYVFMAD